MKDEDEISIWKAKCAALRLQLAINNQFLADIAGILYDNDLHREEDEVLELLRMNKPFIG